MRQNDPKDLEKNTINILEKPRQTALDMEQLNKTKKLKIKELRKIIKILPKENPFNFTEYVEMQNEEIDIGLVFELSEENKIIHNQLPVITLIEHMEKIKKSLFYEWFLYCRWRKRDQN